MNKPASKECQKCGMPIEKYQPVGGVCRECQEIENRKRK